MIESNFRTVLTAISALGIVALLGYTALKIRLHGRDETLVSFAGLVVGNLCWSLSEVAMRTVVSQAQITTAPIEAFGQAGTSLIPMSFLLLSLSYTGRTKWVNRRVVGLLAVEPVVAVALEWTNTGGLMETASGGLGPFHVFHAVYSYALLITGMAMFVRTLLDKRTLYKNQTTAIVAGVTIPFVFNVVSTFDLVNTYGVPTPAFFLIWVGAIGYAVFRFRLLDVVPVARDRVMESMRDGFVVVDAQGRVVDINRAARRLLAHDDPVGAPATAVLEQFGDLLVQTESGADNRPPSEQASSGGVKWKESDHRANEREFTLTVDGTTRYVKATASPLSEDHYVGQLVTLRDITERRRVERRYQRVIERSSDIFVVVDEDGTIEYVSPSIESVLGYDAGNIEATGFEDIVHEEDKPRVQEALFDEMGDPGETIRFECRARTAAGQWRVLEAVGRNLIEDPLVEGIIVNARDITERKQRERDLERTNKRLEEFASVVAHDLRNPLSVATGHLALAEEDGDSEHVDEANDALDRMQDLLEDLLTLARQGQTVDETERVDVGQVATDAWDVVETGDLDLTIDGDVTIEADPSRLQQLLENLFRNAVKHADGATEIRIEATPDGFSVVDDGPGIPLEERDKVFEHGHTTTDDGTGFGLSIVENIVEAHGWEVTLTDSDEEGVPGTDDDPAAQKTDGSRGTRFEITGVERPAIRPT